MTIATLSDIKKGAEAFLKSPSREGLTAVEKAAYNEFVDFMKLARECEWDMEICAKSLVGGPRCAADAIRGYIEENQPEPDHFGNAADRGYDERKERGEA
jgi:hypothetical protein